MALIDEHIRTIAREVLEEQHAREQQALHSRATDLARLTPQTDKLNA